MPLIIPLGKKLKSAVRKITAAPPRLSFARRIDRVMTGERVCAMTFDDGPADVAAYPGDPGRLLTRTVAQALENAGAKGTFDVIGTTAGNYPDECGRTGTPSWSGVAFDHYPSFGNDALGGAENCRDTLKLLADAGHEITNHSYSHVIFGRKRIVYGSRKFLPDLESATGDIKKLNELVLSVTGRSPVFMRPPHYADRIAGGFSSYDAIGLCGMQYLGASFDGGGWLPENVKTRGAADENASYKLEVEKCVRPLEEALKNDPDALCGRIIFNKDGFNMAKRSPVADAVPLQLEVLKKYGYRVVTVSELVGISPFSDIAPGEIASAFSMLCKTRAAAFFDNTVKPDAVLTRGQAAVMTCGGREALLRKIALRREKRSPCRDVSYKDEYCGAVSVALERGIMKAKDGLFSPDAPYGNMTRGEFAVKLAEELE